MSMLLLLIAFLLLFFVAWNIGANNTANIMGIPVGSRALTFRNAVLLVFVLEILGALFYGGGVMRTIGSGILGTVGMRLVEAMSIVFLMGVFLTVASYFRLPVSSTQVLVGCVVGYGLATSSIVNLVVMSKIVLSWVLSPFLGILAGFVAYFLVKRYFLSGFLNMHDVGKSFRVFLGLEIVSSALVVFAQGANSIAAVVGVFSGVESFMNSEIIFMFKMLGGVGIGVGMATWGYRVIKTISSKIVAMSPAMCFVSQLAAAVVVLFFTYLGMPVSSVHVVVGAVIGVGIFSKVRTIHWNVVYEIASLWIFILPLSAFVSYLFIRGLVVFL